MAPRAGRTAVADTLASVPAQQIASTLPLINWTVLAALAVGSFAVVAAARLFTPATKGFLSFTAACAAGFGLLTYLSDAGLPIVPSTAVVTADPAFDVPRRVALGVFVVVATITTFAIARGGRARVLLVLGHWYLVTPKLPEAPLVMVSRRLLWIVALQVALFAGWVGFGIGPGATG